MKNEIFNIAMQMTGIVVEILRVSSETGIDIVMELANFIVSVSC